MTQRIKIVGGKAPRVRISSKLADEVAPRDVAISLGAECIPRIDSRAGGPTPGRLRRLLAGSRPRGPSRRAPQRGEGPRDEDGAAIADREARGRAISTPARRARDAVLVATEVEVHCPHCDAAQPAPDGSEFLDPGEAREMCDGEVRACASCDAPIRMIWRDGTTRSGGSE